MRPKLLHVVTAGTAIDATVRYALCEPLDGRLFECWKQGKVDPSFIFTHHLPLADAANAYRMFRDKRQQCIKVALQPEAALKRAPPPTSATEQLAASS